MIAVALTALAALAAEGTPPTDPAASGTANDAVAPGAAGPGIDPAAPDPAVVDRARTGPAAPGPAANRGPGRVVTPRAVTPRSVTRWAEGLDPAPFPDPARDYHPLGASFRSAAAAAERASAAGRAEIEVERIGETVLGRPIWAFHVTDPRAPVERRVLVMAGIHALEWISSETAFRLLDELIVAPPRGARVTVVPVLNVDGRLQSERDVRAGANVYRRGNAAHVDLNRDFAVHAEPTSLWRHLLPGYHTSSPQPLSQPESRAIDALAARERFDRAASLHAYGGYFYVPWAGRWGRPEDYAELFALGRAMEAAQGRHAYRTRQLSRWGFFFRAHGAEIDHLYGRYGTRAFLIELTRSGVDPFHPKRYFRWYGPSDPSPHVDRGVAALRALIDAPG